MVPQPGGAAPKWSTLSAGTEARTAGTGTAARLTARMSACPRLSLYLPRGQPADYSLRWPAQEWGLAACPQTWP